MIGDTLRAERERQNLSIKDIEKGTSIRALYIEAIEKGEYKTLPGDVYTKGFIRNYANFLKLDADAAVKQYNEENHPDVVAAQEAAAQAEAAAKAEQEKQSVPRMTVKKTAPAREERRATRSDFEARVESSHHRQTLVMGLVAVVVIAAGAFFLFGTEDDSAATKAPQTKVTTQAKSSSSSAAKPQPAVAAPVEQKKAYTDVQVSAKFSARCWVSVKADGKEIFEGTIEQGESKEWKANKELKLTAGNAGAVDLTFNGENKGKLGGEGEVVEKTYALNDVGGKDAAEKSADAAPSAKSEKN